jgi:MerR family copper efflux transcriptional regulator
MQIKELSERTGITRDSIRFYEKIGLFPKPKKKSNGYRDYTDEAVEQMKMLSRAKELGFTLNEIKTLSKLFFTNKLSAKQMSSLLEKKLSEIDEKIYNLKLFKKEISRTQKGLCEYRDRLK